MPNFVITNVCNLKCPFCFASEHHEEETSKHASRMSVAELRRLLELTGDMDARFCGGEPTLHPDFREMLDLALAKPERRVFLMTNGVWPKKVRAHIEALPRRDSKRLGFLFNVLSAEHYAPGQRDELHETLAMARRDNATLGVTLYRAPYDYSHLFALAEKFGFTRVRYSVASPNVTDPDSWNLDPKRDFPLLAPIVYHLMMEARARGLYVHSDCGYIPPCFFTEQQLADMYPPGDHDVARAFNCSGPVDIGPGGEAWRCYGLYSTMRARPEEFEHIGALGDHFEARTAETPWSDLFEACATCEIKTRYSCAGGCYALRSVHAMQTQATQNLVSIGDDPRFHGAVPHLVEDNLVLTGEAADAPVMLREKDGTWAKVNLSPWERDILAACDGRTTVKEVIAKAQTQTSQKGAHRSAARVIRRFFEQGAIDLKR